MDANDRQCVFENKPGLFILRTASDAAQSNHETADKSALEGVSHPQYRLLGDAYLHGLMVGEARDELDKGKCERFAIV